MTYLLTLLLLLLFAVHFGQASPQQASRSSSFLGSNDFLRSVVSRRDGNIIAAVVPTEGKSSGSVLLCYTSDGKTDHKFGEDGQIRVDFAVEELLLLVGGDKFLAVGQQRNEMLSSNQSTLRIARYHADGKLDTTFGTEGVIGTTLSLDPTVVVRSIEIDNKIIVTGRLSSPNGDVFLLRYLPDGRIDSAFGVNGKITGTFEVPAGPLALKAQSDGGLLLAGVTPAVANNIARMELPVIPDYCFSPRGYPEQHLFFARFRADRSPPPRFDVNSVTPLRFSPFRRVVTAAFQLDGKLLVVGYDVNCHFTLARYLPDGSRDTSFGFQGTVRSNRQMVAAAPLQVQPDGKILVMTASHPTLFLTRYTANGETDRLFGKNGETISTIDFPQSLLTFPTGSILVAGSVYRTDHDLALQRYTPDGHPDTHFGTAGLVTTNLHRIPDADRCETKVPPRSYLRSRTGILPKGIRDEAAAVLVQSDGKIVVAGTTGDAVAVIRHQQNGRLDNTFGNNGIVTTRLGVEKKEEREPYRDTVTALELRSDGKIVVRGRAWDGTGWGFFAVRYHPDGSRDSSLGDNGSTLLAESRNYRNHIDPERFDENDFQVYSVTTQADGKVVQGGASLSGMDELFVLVRYAADGQRDPSFGTIGKVMEQAINLASPDGHRGLSFSPWYNCDGFCQIAVQPDGKILAAGSPFYRSIALFRVHPNGSIDSEFGVGGKVVTEVGAKSDSVGALALQSDGKILVAATCANARHTNFALLRYLPNGRLDPSFGNDGKTTLRVGEEIFDPSLIPGILLGATAP